MLLFGRKKDSGGKPRRILYATDLHGAENTYLKFLNAAKIYKAQICIVGGDITGKAIVPVVEQPDGSYYAYVMGQKKVAGSEEELLSLEREIRFNGMYPYRTGLSEMEELSNNNVLLDQKFEELMRVQIKRWADLARERLQPAGISCYITGGNDDPLLIEEELQKSDYVVAAEGQVLNIDENFVMISTGYGNPTPWNCPRDIPEDDLYAKIEAMAEQVGDMESCIFNLHVPPVDSDLDLCPKLDTSVSPPRPLMGVTISAGSNAVRRAIEKYQPLLALHGHIHESRGVVKIGKTVCINPGSEYSEGILRAAVIDVSKGKVVASQLIAV
ncbi:MAG: metallophosphoesterase family protein [Bacillota bacterium]